jgi:hypothetical protein
MAPDAAERLIRRARAFERISFWVTSIIELILIAIIIWAATDLSTPTMALIAVFPGYLLVRGYLRKNVATNAFDNARARQDTSRHDDPRKPN